MENCVDPDQTLGAVWSGSALFGQTCLSENLGTLRYTVYGFQLGFMFTFKTVGFNPSVPSGLFPYRLDVSICHLRGMSGIS